jgi:DNA-binding winged helix-turn-helix (wHTH) protein
MTDHGLAFSVDLAHQANFQLGGMDVRPSVRQVEFGGVTQTLEPRHLQVLVALWRSGGEVVSREELIESCWGGRAVGDDAINRSMVYLRRLARSNGAFTIENIPRVGYRLVETSGPQKSVKPRLPRAVVGASLAVVVVAAGAGGWLWRQAQAQPATPRVALKPFQTAGDGRDLRALAQAATDGVRAGMVGESPPIAPAADARGAALSIGGLISRSGENYTATVRIDDARSQATLWTGEVTGPATALGEMAAARGMDKLGCGLEAYRRRIKLDEESLALWLRVCDYVGADERTEAQRAAGERLVARAPNFPEALAMTGLINVRWAQRLAPDEERAIRAKARSYAERAIKIDPKLPVAYVVMSMTAPWSAWSEQEAWLRNGLALAPDNPYLNARMSWLLRNVGRYGEARAYAQRSQQLAPFAIRIQSTDLDRMAGRLDDARIQEARMARQLPDNHAAIRRQRLAAAMDDDPAAALKILGDAERRPAGMTPADVEAWCLLSELRSGARHKPATVARALAAGWNSYGHRSPDSANPYIWALLDLGEQQAAVRLMESLRATPSGITPVALFSQEGAQLRRDPSFMPLAASLGLVDYWRNSGRWPDFCTGPSPEIDCKAAAARAGV